MKALDRTRPYGHIIGNDDGNPGARYEQDGRYFDGGGNPVGSPAVDSSAAGTPHENKYAAMHWKQLKVLVEQHGGTWTDKASAIAFLEGKE